MKAGAPVARTSPRPGTDEPAGHHAPHAGRLCRLRLAGLAQAGHRGAPAARGALGPPGGTAQGRARQRLPAAAHDRPRLEAGADARGDLPRLHGAAAAQGAAHRHRLSRAVRLPGPGRRALRRAQGRRGTGRARGPGLRLLAPLCAAPAPAGAQSRGLAGAAADHGDHDHRPALRRLPLRAVLGGRRGHRATNAALPSRAARSPPPSPAGPRARCRPATS